MTTQPALIHVELGFELRFTPLRGPLSGISVPCDRDGAVDLDDLDDETRQRYLYAHTLIGRDFARPVVRCVSATIN